MKVTGYSKERSHRYYATHKGRIAENEKEYRANNRHKSKAHAVVNRMVKTGEMMVPVACQKCGDGSMKLHAHHEDYNKPTDVIWLCPSCHFKIHKKVLIGKTVHRGSECKTSKLSEEIVSQIKEMIRDGISMAEISRMVNVSDTAIHFIKDGKTWKHVA